MGSLLQPISDFFLQILTWIHDTGQGHLSWAVSIIILTVIFRVVLIPLTVKQYTSMRAMQKVQPKIKEIQQKYKDDRAKLNEEVMKIYKEHKVNPFGSCLPLLIQMPVMIALYYMLRNQPFTEDHSFLWINNIKDPDTILVFAYMGTQLLSSKLLSTAVDKTQQMMMLLMPLMFGVIFLFSAFPAGVLIYWVTTNVWTVGQQLVVMRIMNARDSGPVVVATEPVVAPAAPGKTGGKPNATKSKSKKKRR